MKLSIVITLVLLRWNRIVMPNEDFLIQAFLFVGVLVALFFFSNATG